jgi:signal transduction histidine kinase
MQPKHFRMILICGLLMMVPLVSSGQQDPVKSTDSLFRIRPGTSGLERARIDLELARYHFPRNMDSVMYYVSLLETHIEEDYDARIDAFINKFRGYKAHLDLDVEKAMEHAREALVLFQQVNDFKEMGWISMNLGTNYYRLGDFATATEHYLKGLAFFEQVDHHRGIAEAYNNLGRVSYQTGNREKARDYFETSLEIFSDIDDEVPALKIFNNLGLLLMEDGLIRESLRNFFIAAEGFDRTGDQRRLALVYGNIAVAYDELPQADSAMRFSRKALAISTQIGDENGMIPGLINLGYFLRLEQKYDSSLICFTKALEMAIENMLPAYEEAVYVEMSDLFVDKEDYRTAFRYHIMQDSIENMIRDEKSQRRIEELMFSYSQRIKDNELLKLREDQVMQERLNLIFLLTIILTFVVVIILVSGYRRNTYQKQLLEEKNDLLEEINLRLEQTDEELREMNQEQSKLFSIVAHDLRNPISAVSGFAELIGEKYDELDDESRREYIEQIKLGASRTLSLLENLLLWARSQMDLVKVKKEYTPVNELIDSCTNHLMSAVEKKNLLLTTDIRDDFTLHVDREMIKAVLRNLISNAIKFSYPGSEIIISTSSNGPNHCISVKDYGTGISPKAMDAFISTGSVTSTEGTAKETGSGLGLLISKDYTEKNGGTIEIESEPGKGSVFTICVPA